MITLNSNNVQVCEQCGAIVPDMPLYLDAHAQCIHGLDPAHYESKKLWSNID